MVVNSNLLNIYKQYREKKLAHAYLIETNNPSKLLEDIKTLIKAINCPEEYQEKCLNCNLCNLINKNNLPSLITIEPDGTSIKKGQIEDLKISFETTVAAVIRQESADDKMALINTRVRISRMLPGICSVTADRTWSDETDASTKCLASMPISTIIKANIVSPTIAIEAPFRAHASERLLKKREKSIGQTM